MRRLERSDGAAAPTRCARRRSRRAGSRSCRRSSASASSSARPTSRGSSRSRPASTATPPRSSPSCGGASTPGGEGARGVNLLTLHRAKGLEFDTVFLPRLEEKELPSRQARTPAEIDEERRLLYVGMTRAKRMLWLSWSGKRSRFLAELGVGAAARAPRSGAEHARVDAGRRARCARGGSSARARTACRRTSSSTTRCCTRSPPHSRASLGELVADRGRRPGEARALRRRRARAAPG